MANKIYMDTELLEQLSSLPNSGIPSPRFIKDWEDRLPNFAGWFPTRRA